MAGLRERPRLAQEGRARLGRLQVRSSVLAVQGQATALASDATPAPASPPSPHQSEALTLITSHQCMNPHISPRKCCQHPLYKQQS